MEFSKIIQLKSMNQLQKQTTHTTLRIILILAIVACSLSAIIETPQNSSFKVINHIMVNLTKPDIKKQIQQNNASIEIYQSEQNDTNITDLFMSNITEDDQINFIQIIQVNDTNKQIFNNNSIVIQLKPPKQRSRFGQQSIAQAAQNSPLFNNKSNTTQNITTVPASNLIKLLQNKNLLQVGTKAGQNNTVQLPNTQNSQNTQNTQNTQNGTNIFNTASISMLSNLTNMLNPVKGQNITSSSSVVPSTKLPLQAKPPTTPSKPPTSPSSPSSSSSSSSPNDKLILSPTPFPVFPSGYKDPNATPPPAQPSPADQVAPYDQHDAPFQPYIDPSGQQVVVVDQVAPYDQADAPFQQYVDPAAKKQDQSMTSPTPFPLLTLKPTTTTTTNPVPTVTRLPTQTPTTTQTPSVTRLPTQTTTTPTTPPTPTPTTTPTAWPSLTRPNKTQTTVPVATPVPVVTPVTTPVVRPVVTPTPVPTPVVNPVSNKTNTTTSPSTSTSTPTPNVVSLTSFLNTSRSQNTTQGSTQGSTQTTIQTTSQQSSTQKTLNPYTPIPIPTPTSTPITTSTTSTSTSSSLAAAAAAAASASASKPVTKIIVNKQFTGIGLYHNIPFTFIQGQYYEFAGVIQNPGSISFTSNVRYNYINIVFSEWGGAKQFRCIQQVTDKNIQFHISCKMQHSGQFFLSIFAGRYGQSSVRQRNILSNSISSLLAPYKGIQSQAVKSKSVSLGVFDNDLIIFWDSKQPISNVTIYQNTTKNGMVKNQYILSNYHEKFKVPFADFNNFEQIQTYISVTHAQSRDGGLARISSNFNPDPTILKFKALAHQHASNQDKLFKIQPSIPWKMNVGQKFKFSGTFGQDVRNQVYLVAPTLEINKVYFTQNQNIKIPSKKIKAGTPVFIEISFPTPGSHIVEINSESGMAIVNRPVYVGEGYPLIPDYEDMQDQIFAKGTDDEPALEEYVAKTTTKQKVKEPEKNASIQEKRQYMLKLLNWLRKKYKVQSVVIDDQLNVLAQMHTDDMGKRNYFSHTSPQGMGPGDRARKINFKGPVGENIAQSNSLTQAHLGLERSASHLENSVNSGWSRVGIGITPTKNGQYIVGFEFSTRDLKKNPLTDQELKKYQQDLIKVIKQKNPNIVRQNPSLSQDIAQWMESDRNTQMFQYIMSSGNYRGPMVSSSFTVNYQDDWVDELKKSDLLKGFSRYKQVGLSLGVQDDGRLESYVVFA